VTSPFLYWTIHGLGDADGGAWKTFTDLYPGDALNPLLPSDVTWIGHGWFEDTTSKFTNFTPAEAGAYVGPVLLGIVVAFAITQWRRTATKLLLAVIVACYVLSLGTELHVAGDAEGVWMPWAALHPLPVFDHVISTSRGLTALFEGVNHSSILYPLEFLGRWIEEIKISGPQFVAFAA